MIKWTSGGSGAIQTLEQFEAHLKVYTLDPTFEKYGDFCIKNPQKIKSHLSPNGNRVFTKDENQEVITDGPCYPGREAFQFFGNFTNISAVFNFDLIVETPEDVELAISLCDMIAKNKATKEYREAKDKRLIREAKLQEYYRGHK